MCRGKLVVDEVSVPPGARGRGRGEEWTVANSSSASGNALFVIRVLGFGCQQEMLTFLINTYLLNGRFLSDGALIRGEQ